MWTKEIKQPTKEIFCDVTVNKIKEWNGIPDDSSTPYEYFVDYLRDNYDVTLKQCDELCTMFKDYYNIDDFYATKRVRYTERLKQIKKREAEFIDNILDEVVTLFKEKHDEPLKVGNIVYYYINDGKKDIPVYRYITDEEFLPIYDRHDLCSYGWHDTIQVATVLDIIVEAIEGK